MSWVEAHVTSGRRSVATLLVFTLASVIVVGVVAGVVVPVACSTEHADRIRKVGTDCAKTITGYLSGNLLLSIICGVSTYAVLKIVGAPFPALVALFVAITDLILLVGATLGAVVASAAASSTRWRRRSCSWSSSLAYQQLETICCNRSSMRGP